ncbi:MAG: hypothetical protein WC309_00790 [Candidatus Paceibacterota bacterium]|jgi:hypothetical protein
MQQQNRKNSKKGILWFLLILLLIIVLVIVLILIFKGRGRTDDKPVVKAEPYIFSSMAHNFKISGNEEEYPLFRGITIDPFYAMAGNTQRISVSAKEGIDYITSAYATVVDDNGSQTIDLELASRVDDMVTWQGEWTIRAVSSMDYPISFVVVDKSGNSKKIDIFWTGQSSIPVSVKTPSILERIKSIFSIPIARAGFVNTQTGTINTGQFPHSGNITINSSIAFGPGIGSPYITGVDGGNVIIPYGKTLELKPNTYFLVNEGYQMIKQMGGYLAVAQDGIAGVYSGYLWAKDNDNDGCFDVSTLRYNNNPSSQDSGWGTGYKRIFDLDYYPEPDDQNAGEAPACTGSSHSLKVVKLGNGNGTITSVYPSLGISCGSVCEVSFDLGTTVTLKAEEDLTSNFTGWTGDCKNLNQGTANIGDCIVEINGNKEVKATFERTSGLVDVEKSGTGTGKVTSSPSGISCGSICQVAFPLNNTVKLTATADSGSYFAGWYNDCTGIGSCNLNILGDKEVEAKFTLGTVTTSYELKVNKTGSGNVNSNNIAGITCGSDCSNLYSPNTIVKLKAEPSPGATLIGWTGCGSVTDDICSVTMTAKKTVTVNFSTTTTYSLDVEKLGSGTGTVTSYPLSGINCGPDCFHEYISGLEVTLTPSVDTNNVFVGWEGCTTTSGNNCKVVMTSPKTVKATFIPAGNMITIDKAGNGAGTVASTDGKINCGSDCSENYQNNALVSLNASPMVGSSFVIWAGADNCNTNPSCTFNVTSGKTITAIFSTSIPNNYTLAISPPSNGRITGTLNSTPIIDCGSNCNNNIAMNSTVVLTATPNSGYTFSSWTGACAGSTTNICTLLMDNHKTVGAIFISLVSQNELNVDTTGTGTGTIISNNPTDGGISCGSNCSEIYNSGANVILTYIVDPDSMFAGWSGDCSGLSAYCSVAMNEPRTVIANFTLKTNNTLTVSRSGLGTVTSSDQKIYCGTTCDYDFAYGIIVTLTATPGNGYRFAGWSGACTNSTGTCSIAMQGPKNVTAIFEPSVYDYYSLSVYKEGYNLGSVTGDGINCGTSCHSQTKAYGRNTTVTLTATPYGDSSFAGWSGACYGTGNCVVTMTNNKNVTATFNGNISSAYTLTVNASGSGAVTSSPTGLTCRNSVCKQTFSAGTPVTLTATPDSGATFENWEGDFSGIGSCTLVMDRDKTITAIFGDNESYNLSASKIGTGTGSIISQLPTAGAISCGSGCTGVSKSFTKGTTVSLIATAIGESTFTGWSGVCNNTVPTCTFVMDSPKDVAAEFTATDGGDTPTSTVKSLTVSTDGDGYGYVQTSSEDIKCGDYLFFKYDKCSATYENTTSVTLTATKGSGSFFAGWGGACSGTETTCTVSVDSVKNVTATFTQSEKFSVTVNKLGTGTGYVGGGGIICQASCTTDTAENWSKGEVITLKVYEVSFGSVFAGWGGDCSGTGDCILTMNSNKTVTATFNLDASKAYVNLQNCPATGLTSGVWIKHNLSSWSASKMCEMNHECTYQPFGCWFLGSTGLRTWAGGVASSYGWAGYCLAAVASTFDICVKDSSSVAAHNDLPACPFTGTAGTVYAKNAACGWDYKCQVNKASCKQSCGKGVVETDSTYGVQCRWPHSCTLCMVGGTGGVPSTKVPSLLSIKITIGGTVTGSLAIICGEGNEGELGCIANGEVGGTITLDPVAKSGYDFKSWEGCTSVSGNKCTVKFTAEEMSAKAIFEPSSGGGTTPYTLTLNKSGTSTGAVYDATGQISCNSLCSSDTGTFNSGASVILTASPATGSTVSWSGCTSTSGTTCNVTMTSPKTVTATFNSSSTITYTLTARKSGTGTGTIYDDLGKIACTSSCTSDPGTYNSGTKVVLTATPSSDSTFVSWSGCTSTSGTTCNVTMTSLKTVTATFNKASTSYTLTVKKSGTGFGAVYDTTGQISCNSSCSQDIGTFNNGTTAAVTATPQSGSTFVSWSGCDTVTGTTCYVKMSYYKIVTVTFSGTAVNDPTCGPTTSCTSSSSCGYFYGKEGKTRYCPAGTTYVSHMCLAMPNNHVVTSSNTTNSAFCQTDCDGLICLKTDGCISIQCK